MGILGHLRYNENARSDYRGGNRRKPSLAAATDRAGQTGVDERGCRRVMSDIRRLGTQLRHLRIMRFAGLLGLLNLLQHFIEVPTPV